jgi:hypothetical protein
MQSANAADTVRRSSRVPISLPVVVTSFDPHTPFSETCETMVVSAHGCSIHSPMRLEAGIPVQFRRKGGRATTAHVVACEPMASGKKGWQLSATFDRPENFWGLESCPEDWAPVLEMHPAEQQPSRKLSSLKIVPDKTQQQPMDYDLRALIAEAIQPLQAEVMELREKLGRGDQKRSRFEISLSQIPPEVEEKLGIRLREDLGAQVLQQTRQQSDQVFEAAKDAIGKKIREAQSEFREHLTQELQTVEQRAQGISGEIADSVGQYLRSGAERFQQQVSEAGSRAERQSDELLQALLQRLSQEHDAYRRELQKAQAAAASESSRLQTQLTGLGSRMAELDDCACRLESELDARLARMANDSVSAARVQLETAVDVVLKELGTRNAKELGIQLDTACGKLKTVQKGIEASVSELVKTEVAASLLSFGQTMEVLAQDSVGRWRDALAKDLTSVAKILGGEFRLQASSDKSENEELAE